MILRTDSMNIAGWKRSAKLGGRVVNSENDVSIKSDYASVPPAELDEVWIIRTQEGDVTGYGLTCPNTACDQGAHAWTHAYDCSTPVGPDHWSCWSWTGSVESSNLTANPSLWVARGCGWHGFLRNGKMESV